jgi:hypothetical protein
MGSFCISVAYMPHSVKKNNLIKGFEFAASDLWLVIFKVKKGPIYYIVTLLCSSVLAIRVTEKPLHPPLSAGVLESG